MTHRERVLAAVNRQETDRTPLDFGGTLATSIVPATYEKLNGTQYSGTCSPGKHCDNV